jgi:hypothetical protein
VDEDLLKAAANEEVKSMLQQKISRERIGKELKGMFTRGPMYAFRLLHQLELPPIVFALPSGASKKR